MKAFTSEAGEVLRRYLKKASQKERGDIAVIEATVREMLADIRLNRDDAVCRYAEKLDNWTIPHFRVSPDEIRDCRRVFQRPLRRILMRVQKRDWLRAHQRDSMHSFEVEIEPGIWLGQKLIPVNRVGCYVPGGKYPLYLLLL